MFHETSLENTFFHHPQHIILKPNSPGLNLLLDSFSHQISKVHNMYESKNEVSQGGISLIPLNNTLEPQCQKHISTTTKGVFQHGL